MGWDINKIHQVLAYADDLNLIGDDIRRIERNADALLNACKDIDLEVNVEKNKYMAAGHHRDMMANERKSEKLSIFRFFNDKSTFYSRGNKI